MTLTPTLAQAQAQAQAQAVRSAAQRDAECGQAGRQAGVQAHWGGRLALAGDGVVDGRAGLHQGQAGCGAAVAVLVARQLKVQPSNSDKRSVLESGRSVPKGALDSWGSNRVL